MKLRNAKLALSAALLMSSALPGVAQTSDTTTRTAPPLQQGSTVNNAAKANQKAPGDARELSPDTKQSATGGPAGGTGRGGTSGGN